MQLIHLCECSTLQTHSLLHAGHYLPACLPTRISTHSTQLLLRCVQNTGRCQGRTVCLTHILSPAVVPLLPFSQLGLYV